MNPNARTKMYWKRRIAEEGANVVRWEIVIIDGKEQEVPVPINCSCGIPSCYGKNGLWFCTDCWLKYRVSLKE